MSRWFKFLEKPIVVDCFTDLPHVFEFSKIRKSTHFYPEWWKNLPKVDDSEFYPTRNMRGCSGFIDQFRTSFALPIWSDLSLKVSPINYDEYEWQFSDRISEIEVHSHTQSGNFYSPLEYQHFKIRSPWFLKSRNSTNFSFIEPTWNLLPLKYVRVLPGVLNFKYQYSSNINILVEKGATERIVRLPFKTPLIHIQPQTEKKVIFKHHLVSREEFLKQSNLPTVTFINSYFNIKKYMEKGETE